MGPLKKQSLSVRNERTTNASVERMTKQVADLFQVNAVFVLQVDNYYQMSERAKYALCDTLMNITLCKVPARNGKGMWFFMSKEVRL